MLSIVLVLGLVTYASATGCCSHGDQEVIKSQWNSLWNTPDSSSAKIIFGTEVFKRFFAKVPGATALFTHLNVEDIHSAEFAGHIIRVLSGLDLIVNMLGEDALEAELTHLNKQHIARDGVRAEYFKEMFLVLDGALRQVLEDYDGLAWRQCFKGVRAALAEDLPA